MGGIYNEPVLYVDWIIQGYIKPLEDLWIEQVYYEPLEFCFIFIFYWLYGSGLENVN